MNLDLAARLFREARFLPQGEGLVAAALGAVPALADGLPGLRARADASSSPVIPLACGGLVAGPTERALRQALDETLADLRPVPAEEEARKLAADPLVVLLRRLLLEGGSVSPGAMVTVGLVYARACAAHFANPGALVAEQVRQVQGLPAARRGAALARVARLMTSRLSVAILEAARAGRAPPALLGAVATSGLAFVYPRGAFARELDLAVVHLAGGGALPAEQALAAMSAFRQAVGGALGRLAARKGTPDDQALLLRACVPQLLDHGVPAAVDALVADADLWASLLPALGRFTTARELTAAGLSAAQAKSMLRPEVGIAVAGALRSTLAALRAWDVLTCLAASLSPVADDDPLERRLAVPRGHSIEASVVAVGLAGLRSAGDGVALPDTVDGAWASWTSGAGGAARVDLGVVGLLVFPTPLQATRFGANLLERSTLGLPLPPVSVATGMVSGGVDGDHVRIGGPAVAEAMRLLPTGSLAARPEGIHAAARVAVVGGQLAGSGLVIDVATSEGLRRSGLPRHVSKRRPRGLSVREVWDTEEGLLVLLDVPGLNAGRELLRLSPADWAAILDAPPPILPPFDPSEPPARERSRAGRRARSPEERGAPLAFEGDTDEPSEGSAGSGPSASGSEPTWDSPSAASGASQATPSAASTPSQPTPSARSAPSSPTLPTPSSATLPTPSSATLPTPPAELSAASARSATLPPTPLPLPLETPFATTTAESGTDLPTSSSSDPFASDPFAADRFTGAGAAGSTPAGEAARPSASDPFADVFGIPADSGETFTPAEPAPPAASAPMIPEGGFSMEVEEDDLDDPSALERSDGRSVVEEPLGFSLPLMERGAEPAPESPRRASLPPVNFDHVLTGYACYVEHDRVVFGRPYGTRLIDHHSYDVGSDLGRAYEQFLGDKIREGFIPQTEMVGELPRGVTVMPLEAERLAAAWRALT